MSNRRTPSLPPAVSHIGKIYCNMSAITKFSPARTASRSIRGSNESTPN